MPPAKELRALRHGIPQMLHRRKLKVSRELEIEQVNEQRQPRQREEHGEQRGIQEAHVAATIAHYHRSHQAVRVRCKKGSARGVAFATLVD
jgi:hypothetical protein